ncbi:metal ABC transporter ATP-binding protein [Gymnodinialimonas ceratoperidinii]|uniref:Metal ABC transporter ATP-binding protein n=1 Tax=Gymnodinialimonas ceratoperidinii TaxID=2856823 RepID=A0A8F6YBH3_9RHOB|nr:metal ABC transporter ATP-binding protein [Gymnodinialimonas ceratoperidinii]QXT38182.1 metal ABC transporter ATP-binding protein [Gymnodinialimonas ceratoperidinii]
MKDFTAPTQANVLDPASPLAVRGMTVSYGEKPALFSLDATFPAGAMSAIVGPNGAGKSTFLKAALGLIPRVSGEVSIFGQEVAATRDRISYVPQRASVDWDFPTTAIDVVLMGLYGQVGLWRRISGAHRERARACLDRVGMADFADRQIGQLSGGQQQRVFLARALAQEADLFLLDEPFAGVDAATESAIIDVLKSLKAEGRSVVAVHHDLSTVTAYFDHVMLINLTRIAEGPVAEAFTEETLSETYGGRLGAVQIDSLALSKTGPKPHPQAELRTLPR